MSALQQEIAVLLTVVLAVIYLGCWAVFFIRLAREKREYDRFMAPHLADHERQMREIREGKA